VSIRFLFAEISCLGTQLTIHKHVSLHNKTEIKMIPIFRKTRKKMADDNKPMKYLRYAIGEIILVVIGILIALSINNWNENRK